MRHSLPSFREPTPPVISEYWGSGMFSLASVQAGEPFIQCMKSLLFLFFNILRSLKKESCSLGKNHDVRQAGPGCGVHPEPPTGRMERKAAGRPSSGTATELGETNMPRQKQGALVRQEDLFSGSRGSGTPEAGRIF